MVKKLIIPVSIILLVILGFFLPPRVIKISDITCMSQYGNCPDEINSRLSSIKGKNLIDSKKEISKILKDNFLISDFSSQFKIPSKINVNLVIRKAVFALNQKETSNYTLIDKDGFVVAISDKSSLPTVIVDRKLNNVGEKTNTSDLFTLNLISGIFNMYQINIGEIKNGSLVVELPTPLTVIFPIEGDESRDSNYYLGVLRLIITKIETESPGKYREIDLRFKNPVLR